MDSAVFEQLCRIAYERAGIHLKDGKQALVASRIAKRMRVLGLPSEQHYLDYLQSELSEQEIVYFLNVISTNFTSFFRENDHFELMSERLETWLAEGRQKFRFWCAASSTGQEPYSIAITAEEVLGGRADYRILATDISTDVLAAAARGWYAPSAIEGVSHARRARYFQSAVNDSGQKGFQVAPELRQRISFTRLNLATPPFPMSGPLDIVFCRNVMIYFDLSVRDRLISDIERLLRPGGYLLIGHTETLNGLSTGLRVVAPSIYRKADPGAGQSNSSPTRMRP